MVVLYCIWTITHEINVYMHNRTYRRLLYHSTCNSSQKLILPLPWRPSKYMHMRSDFRALTWIIDMQAYTRKGDWEKWYPFHIHMKKRQYKKRISKYIVLYMFKVLKRCTLRNFEVQYIPVYYSHAFMGKGYVHWYMMRVRNEWKTNV